VVLYACVGLAVCVFECLIVFSNGSFLHVCLSVCNSGYHFLCGSVFVVLAILDIKTENEDFPTTYIYHVCFYPNMLRGKQIMCALNQ
jgi:hypothetical protein